MSKETVVDVLRVGFVGVGNLGMPVARRIAHTGWQLSVWARRPEMLSDLEALGVVTARDLVDLGRRSDVVGVLVTDVDDVLEVLESGLLDGMQAGGVVVIHSTVPPEACQHVAKLTAQVGVDVIDAPLCGGARAAAIGKLLVPVGGEEATVERCRPLLESFGGFVRRVGPLGTGQRFKLLYNLLFTANVEIVMNALDVGDRLGLDRDALSDMFSSLPYTGFVGNALATGRAGAAGVEHGCRLLMKDVSYALRMLAEASVDGGTLADLGDAGLRSMSRHTDPS